MAIYGLNTIKEETQAIIEEKEDRSLVPTFQSDRVKEEVRSFIGGYKWDVTYFHRVIDNMDQVTEYDPNLDPTLQDYVRIDNLRLTLDSPLPAGIGDDLKGTAYIDVDIIPNPNDLFIAKLMDGKSVIFVVESVTRVNYNNDNLFRIDFALYGEYDSIDDTLISKLLDSTTEELIYNPDYRRKHDEPLYTKEDYLEREEGYKRINKLINLWRNNFIKPSNQYFIGYRDSNNQFVYDPQMNDFIKDIIGYTNLDIDIEEPNIIDRDYSILDYLVNPEIPKGDILEFSIVEKPKILTFNPYINNIPYSIVAKVVKLTPDEVEYKDNGTVNDVFPKIPEGRYIFRKEVYDSFFEEDIDVENLTIFEQQFLAMINKTVMDANALDSIYKNVRYLDTLEQFYYIPIIIAMIKYYLTTFTVEFI